jgi:hypothetical protein
MQNSNRGEREMKLGTIIFSLALGLSTHIHADETERKEYLGTRYPETVRALIKPWCNDEPEAQLQACTAQIEVASVQAQAIITMMDGSVMLAAFGMSDEAANTYKRAQEQFAIHSELMAKIEETYK